VIESGDGSGLPPLQEGWRRLRLAEIGAWVGGGTPSKQRSDFWDGGDVPWLSPKDMKATLLSGTQDAITAAAVEQSAAKRFSANSIALVVRSGILEHTLPVALVPFEAAANQDMRVVTPHDEIDPEWLLYALLARAEEFRRRCRKDGTTVASIEVPRLMEALLEVPPLEEQRRIVKDIGALFAEIELAATALRTTGELFEAFQASVLEALYYGELLGDFQGTRTISGTEALPQGWRWITLAEAASDERRAITDGPFGSNLKSSHYTAHGPRVIRLQNIGVGEFLNAEAHVSHEHFEALKTHEAKAGDVVMASLGDDLPRACVVPAWLGPAIVKADCPRVRPRSEVNPEFLAACLNSRPVRKQAATTVHGVGRTRLKLADAKRLRLPLPPRAIQDEFVARLTEMSAGVSELSRARDAALAKADRMKRSILSQVLTGQLSVLGEKAPENQSSAALS